MRAFRPAVIRTSSIAGCIVAGAMLAACASTDALGWHGTGAEPFDGAKAACTQAVAGVEAGTARDDAFDTCMANKGWTHP